MNVTGKGVKVCVTGASGYIASWLVKLLLERGYTVNGTVRDPDDMSKTRHLRGLAGAKERLHLFKADLLKEGDFDSPICGCLGVFHTASPVISTINDPQVDVLDPAIKGTLNVLTSCNKFSSVRRVVLTSSIFAVVYNCDMNLAPEMVVDESWFADPDRCTGPMKWYSISKTLAEDLAWKFAKENGIDMVSLNPGLVIGPMLQPTINESVAIIWNLINGAKTYPNASFGCVNVKDVANAHVLAFENPSANGRYCLVQTVAHLSEFVKILQELYPKLALPNKKVLSFEIVFFLSILTLLVIICTDIAHLKHHCRCQDDKPFVPTYQVSQEKARSLGIEYIPLKMSLVEPVEDLKGKGFCQL